MTTDTLVAELQRVRAADQSRKEDSQERYFRAVFDSAQGKEVSPEFTAQAIADYGVDIARFESDCERYVQRARWADDSQCARNANQTIERCTTEIGKLVAEREAAVSKFNLQINALAGERGVAMDSTTKATIAKRKLVESAWPFLVEQERGIRAQLATIGSTLQEIALSIRDERNNIARHSELRDWDNSKASPARRERRLVGAETRESAKHAAIEAQRRLEGLEKRQAELKAECAALLSGVEKIQQRKLVP